VSKTEQRSPVIFLHTWCRFSPQEGLMLGYGVLGTIVVIAVIVLIVRAL
jgi:hypothetical protein